MLQLHVLVPKVTVDYPRLFSLVAIHVCLCLHVLLTAVHVRIPTVDLSACCMCVEYGYTMLGEWWECCILDIWDNSAGVGVGGSYFLVPFACVNC